jgi:hypothetical protein
MTLTNLIESDRGLPISLSARKIAQINNDGVAKTLFWKDVAIATAGINIPWNGLGFAWAIISPFARRRPHVKVMHDNVKFYLNTFINDYKLRRVEAQVDTGLTPGQVWIEKLGFIYENLIPKYGPTGNDFFRYVILRES